MSVDWKIEIVECGEIVQDEDETVPQDEAERQWNRYVELADSVSGDEGSEAVVPIVSSLKVRYDYGAYQAAYGALERFPPADLGKGVAWAAEELTRIPYDQSGVVLVTVARSPAGAVEAFNEAVKSVPGDVRSRLRDVVDFHESNEWLAEDEDKGIIKVPRE
ncbi:hypothetical protein SAMN04487904_107162 [Actinopolyspora lacussalsi subsp. righensis]|uniref:Uncharacterized protein n=1 Tax=Actinopolyspora righensis TaxID=995060 RepID=A0A1I7AKL6_9ACTN|nr:hypothetical protein [Actinopolyspora righensis]SFT75472.1 hypothetical protein SAMN04487904_107162 [Actinopolyspora righensis]